MTQAGRRSFKAKKLRQEQFSQLRQLAQLPRKVKITDENFDLPGLADILGAVTKGCALTSDV
jgi:hypothetical protein